MEDIEMHSNLVSRPFTLVHPTIMSIAGHVSPKMLAHYSHVRIEAKRSASDALAVGNVKKDKQGSYDTNNDTATHGPAH